MTKLTQSQKEAVRDFAMEDLLLRHEGQNVGAFKARHYKKALKKYNAGKPLTRVEEYWVDHPTYPEFDMDGSRFQPIHEEDWGSKFTGYAPNEGT